MKHLRALFIAFHVLAITLAALPAPTGSATRKGAWKQPTVQEEFDVWTARLNAIGWQGDDEDLERFAWSFVKSFNHARHQVLKPFVPYYAYAGTGQSWRMFVAPHRNPSVLHIDVEEGGAWRPLYVARSSVHTWHRHQLDHDRMRAAIFRYSWPGYERHWYGFGKWAARQVAAERPEATRIRLRFWNTRTPPPEKAHLEQKGRYGRSQFHTLDRYR